VVLALKDVGFALVIFVGWIEGWFALLIQSFALSAQSKLKRN
jgi:hypothetical protein